MLSEFRSKHLVDDDGNPAGGTSQATGIIIVWQDGPLGRGEDRIPPNGAFVETGLAMIKDRIEWYNSGKFACAENADAIYHIEKAMAALNSRTKRREEAGTEGLHKGS